MAKSQMDMATAIAPLPILAAYGPCSPKPLRISQVAACRVAVNYPVSVHCTYKKNVSLHVYNAWKQFPGRISLWSYAKGNLCTASSVTASDTGLEESKESGVIINDRQITVESREDGKIHVRVDVTGKDTQKTFDRILKTLASEAGPVPGFRRQKGGKTTNVPPFVLLKTLGKSRVRKFVIQEIISSTVADYVKKENLKVKSDLSTKESAEELDATFEPGKELKFHITLELEEEQSQKELKEEESQKELEKESQSQPES